MENIWEHCDKSIGQAKVCPFDAILPPGLRLLAGQEVQVVAYDDQSFGFLRLTTQGRSLYGEFFTATAQALSLADSFCLKLDTHRLESAG